MPKIPRYTRPIADRPSQRRKMPVHDRQFVGTISGRSIYSDGHVLKFGQPPKRWRSDCTVDLSSLQKLIQGPLVSIRPVAFGRLSLFGEVIVFDNGTLIDCLYFDMLAHLTLDWQIASRKSKELPIVAIGKAGRPVGIVSPIYDPSPTFDDKI